MAKIRGYNKLTRSNVSAAAESCPSSHLRPWRRRRCEWQPRREWKEGAAQVQCNVM
jgi:hypothetical protein